MGHSWMNALRTSEEYENGVEEFIEFARRNVATKNGMYYCPCVNCLNENRRDIDDIRDHLLCDGINLRYTTWIWHGEEVTTSASHENEVEVGDDGMERMIHDVEVESVERTHEYDSVRSDAETPLFPGCSKYTRLTGTLHLVNLKATCGWTDSSFTKLLELLCDMLPDDNVLPNRMYEAKKILSMMGMEYKKIHSCPNDCILYRNEYEGLSNCPKCKTSRYKMKKGGRSGEQTTKRQPLKAMWYLPIIPRFKRLFTSEATAKRLRWHSDERISDGKFLRHPADSQQWKKIDEMFPQFGNEPRNLRLGICTDGFNPYGTLSSTHSAWPVFLVIYNLPPWLCMKRKYVMLSMMISGPKQPGNNIDVYLAPLVEDLKKLWEEGVDVFDAYKKESFKLRAMIFTTINDFPAYGNLSGYSVKGHKACPICEANTDFHQLKHGKKTVYLGHRRFLHRFHPYRKLRKRFNGLPEHRMAPKALTGEEVYSQVEHLNVILGKQQKTPGEKNIWKKRSIFFDLPYWRSLDVRHSLDVMHVEKNVCDSLVSTLLHIPGKTKDGINARLDLVDMGIRERLHPQVREDGKRAYMEPAAHTLSKVEKKSLCGCLYDIKVPQGYSSNLRRCVSMDDLKLVGMKSHDYHVLMQQLLPIAVRGIMKDEVRTTITKLCIFMNAICNKVIDIDKLDELENEGYIILSQLEMHFPPAFFDIMVHLIVHLVREVRLCGPVYLRWMYPFERYMKILKGYSKNPYRPEASIVERYVVEEAMDFCKDYLLGATIQSQHEEEISQGTRGIKLRNMSREEVLQAHLYILNNMEEVQPYIDEHRKSLKNMNPRKNDMQIANEQKKTFIKWFEEKVLHESGVSDTIEWFAWGPSFQVITWSGYDINGYSFYTKDQDDKSSMQNSGVMVEAESMHFSSSKDRNPVLASMAYYGVIEEIWEMTYNQFKVALFKCKWVNNNAVVRDPQFGFVSVDLQRVGYRDEPFILASQAKQVFYVTDPANKKMSIVLESKKQRYGEESFNLDDTPPFTINPPSFNLDDTPPFTTNPPTPREVEMVDDDDYAARNDHCEGIWETI